MNVVDVPMFSDTAPVEVSVIVVTEAGTVDEVNATDPPMVSVLSDDKPLNVGVKAEVPVTANVVAAESVNDMKEATAPVVTFNVVN